MGAGLDLRARRADGSTLPVDISLSPVRTGDEVEVIAAIRDRTEREALRRMYQTVVRTAPDAMFVVDAESGEILEVNERATELMDSTEADLVGRDQIELHPGEDAARYRDLFRQHVEDEQTVADRFHDGDELYVETDGGDRVPVEISAQVTGLNGRRVVVALFRDVSRREEYEAELQRQANRFETLAHVLSHDLRNPLTVAEGRLDLFEETDDPEQLEQVRRAHGRMEEIIDDALTMIRDGYDVEAVDPLELGAVASEYWEHVATADATLRVVDDGVVYADATRVGNLFENLFRNAVEHGGDAVTVRVGVYDGGFFVADDGPGIPASERDTVFEVGWSTGADDTGLGLNIVAQIARAHDWEVSVGESETGGARFDFRGVETAVYGDSFDAEPRDES
ncbi:MAG: PAS domain S-box protein [Halobacteriaceae archaeon]